MKKIQKIIIFSCIFIISLFITAILFGEKHLSKRLIYAKEGLIIMSNFKQALKNSEWETALSYCSEEIREKAKNYNSAKALFYDIIPVKKINKFPRLHTIAESPPDWKLKHFVILTDSEEKPVLEWSCITKKKEDKWVINFETIPLKSLIKNKQQEEKERQICIKKLKSKLSKIEIRLIPLKEKYILGQPMRFRLEMVNHNDSTLYYHWRYNRPNKPRNKDDWNWIIKYPDGKTAPYIRISFMGSTGFDWPDYNYKPIKPGKAIILYKKYNINDYHYIDKPGRYTVQYNGKGITFSLTNKSNASRGRKWFKVSMLIYKSMETKIKKDKTFSPGPIPSNIAEIDIAPGQLSKDDLIMGKLINILPDKWRLTKMVTIRYHPDKKDKVTPEGRGIVEGSGYYLRHSRVKIKIWFVKKMIGVATKENDPSFQFRTDDPKKRILSEYLGKYSDQYIYAEIPPKADAIWLKFRDEILEVFNISK